MARYKKPNSMSEQIMDIFIEITDFSWKFGAFISAVFLFLSVIALKWAVAYNTPDPANSYVTAVVSSIGWLVYFIPLLLFVIGCFFALRSLNTYSKQSHW